MGGPDTLEPGETADVKLALMYFPEYPYDEVQSGRRLPFVKVRWWLAMVLSGRGEWNRFPCPF